MTPVSPARSYRDALLSSSSGPAGSVTPASNDEPEQREMTSFFKRFDPNDAVQVAQAKDRAAKEREAFEQRKAAQAEQQQQQVKSRQETERDRKRRYRAKRAAAEQAAAERALPGPLPILDHSATTAALAAVPTPADQPASNVPPVPDSFLPQEQQVKRQALWARLSDDERIVLADATNAVEVEASISEPPTKPGRKAGKRVRSERKAPEPKQAKRNNDHFLRNQGFINKIHKLVVDPQTRERLYKVKTPGELERKLKVVGVDIPRTTLAGWFTFVGQKAACAEFPKPQPVFWEGRAAGYNVRLRRSKGRKAVLAGAEPTLQRMTTELRAVRASGVSLTTVSVKTLLVNALIEDGHQGLLSPDLYDLEGEEDKSKFNCSPFWVRSFMISRLGYSWRVSTKAAQKLPDNWQELRDEALQRIAALTAKYNIPKERVFMADETFLFYSPESKCALQKHEHSVTIEFLCAEALWQSRPVLIKFVFVHICDAL